jgi:hypothetical protein
MNTHWDGTIITKPTFHLNTEKPYRNQVPANMYISCEMEGTLEPNVFDGSDDYRKVPFSCTVFATTMENAEKYMKAAKKAIHQEAVTGGFMRITNFRFDQLLDQVKLEFSGYIFQIIQDDGW